MQEFSLFFMSMERGILDEELYLPYLRSALHCLCEPYISRAVPCEASAKEVLPEPPVPSLPSKPKAPRKSAGHPGNRRKKGSATRPGSAGLLALRSWSPCSSQMSFSLDSSRASSCLCLAAIPAVQHREAKSTWRRRREATSSRKRPSLRSCAATSRPDLCQGAKKANVR